MVNLCRAVAVALPYLLLSPLSTPPASGDPVFSPNEIAFLKDIRAIGANPSNNQTAVKFGYNICRDIQSGTPESILIEGIAGYTDAEMNMPQRPVKPTEAQAQQLIYAAIRDLCPNAR